MIVEHLDHITLRCRPQDLSELVTFYVELLGLEVGARPAFSFPGHWLYSDGHPVLHVAGILASRPSPETGPLDHVAFIGVDLDRTRKQLSEKQLAFEELPVPGYPLHQIFFRDPQGLKVELTFRIPKAGSA